MHLVKWQPPVISLMIVLLINLFLSAPGHASNAVTTLATFQASQLVLTPSSLVEGPDGNFYAAASTGGYTQSGYGGTSGSIVQITPQGVITTLHSFAAQDGFGPTGLVLGPDGNLYGTAATGGIYDGGTLFQITTGGAFNVVYAFPNGTSSSRMGAGPTQLTVGVDGNLYGMTEGGGANACGALFRITLAGVPTVLYSFPQIGGGTGPGADPMAVDSNGTLYGIGGEGLFSLQTNGVYTILHQFGSGQGMALGQGIVRGSDGSLYGPDDDGTTNNTNHSVTAEFGSIYKLSGGVFTSLFTAISSSSLIDGGDGFFYGAGNGGQGTCSCGQIFKFNASGTFVSAYYFNGVTDGGPPTTPLIRGSDGYFYGATATTMYRFDSTAPPPPAIVFTANPSGIVLGSPATLSWNAVNASTCVASNAWSGSVATSGSTAVTPAAAGELDYTLTCSGTGGTTVSTYRLLIDAPASATISISPTTVNIGQTAVISWSGSSSCVKSGAWGGTFSGTGTTTLSVSQSASGSYVYTLTCAGAYGISSARASATLTVNPLPTLSISVSPQTIAPGASAALTWSTTNATSCVAANAWSGGVATSGSQNVTPSSAGNYTYALTCVGAGGTITNSVTLAVVVPVSLPTETIATNPSSIPAGQSASLTWSSANATSCTAETAWNGSVGTSGTQTISPATPGTFTYAISCTGPGGTTTSSATLAVTAPPSPPTVTLSSGSSSITVGQSVDLSWSSTNATSCSAGGEWSGSMATSGSVTSTPTTAGVSTYTLGCTGPGGSASATATITVTAAAAPSGGKSGGGEMGWPALIGLGAIVAMRTRWRKQP